MHSLNAQETYNLVKKTKRDVKNCKADYYNAKYWKIQIEKTKEEANLG